MLGGGWKIPKHAAQFGGCGTEYLFRNCGIVLDAALSRLCLAVAGFSHGRGGSGVTTVLDG